MPAYRLLVVADTKMLPALANGLRDGGKFDVITVPLGDLAAARTASAKADALLVFYGAPDRPLPSLLLELAPALRERGACVVAVLQREQGALRDECFRNGASDLLFMPMPKDQFVGRLASTVGRSFAPGPGTAAEVSVATRASTTQLAGATVTAAGLHAAQALPLRAGESVRLSWARFQAWGVVVQGGPAAQIRFAGLAPDEEAQVREWLAAGAPRAASPAAGAPPAPDSPASPAAPGATPAAPGAAAIVPGMPASAAAPGAALASAVSTSAAPDSPSDPRAAPAAGPPPGFADRRPIRPQTARAPLRISPLPVQAVENGAGVQRSLDAASGAAASTHGSPAPAVSALAGATSAAPAPAAPNGKSAASASIGEALAAAATASGASQAASIAEPQAAASPIAAPPAAASPIAAAQAPGGPALPSAPEPGPADRTPASAPPGAPGETPSHPSASPPSDASPGVAASSLFDLAAPAPPAATAPSWPDPAPADACRKAAFQLLKDNRLAPDLRPDIAAATRRVAGLLGSAERAALDKAGPESHLGDALTARIALEAATAEGVKLYASPAPSTVDAAAVAALTQSADAAAARLQKEANQAISKGEVELLQLVTAASAALSRDLLSFKAAADRLRGIGAAPRLGAGALDPDVILPGQAPRAPATKPGEPAPVRAELRDFKALDRRDTGRARKVALALCAVLFVVAAANALFFALPHVREIPAEGLGAGIVRVDVAGKSALVTVTPEWVAAGGPDLAKLIEVLRDREVEKAMLTTTTGIPAGTLNVVQGRIIGLPRLPPPPPPK